MKTFKTAAVEVVTEEEREAKIKVLIEQGKTQQEAEAEVDDEEYIEFELDGRVMKAYPPTPGQLTFMLAALGRGQSQDSRFASIINIMMESLDENDQDYLEGRLLSRKRGERLDIKQVEEIFEYLVEEWFARPTQSSSDSADSPPSASQN